MAIIKDRKPAIYLAGAMTYTPDRGGGWRESVTPQLEEMGLEVLDPRNIELPGTSPEQIVRSDIGAIARSSFVLAYGGAPSWGTAMELWQAKQLSVPVVTWLGTNDTRMSAWLLFVSHVVHVDVADALDWIRSRARYC